MCAYFLYQAYEIWSNQEKWASRMMSNYKGFEKWWNKQLCKDATLKNFLWQVPAYGDVSPQRSRICLVFMYCNLVGALLLSGANEWSGVGSAVLFLAFTVQQLVASGALAEK